MNLAIRAFLFFTFSLSICSCKKLISIQAPVTSVNEANVYADDGTAISVLTGIYTGISSNGIFTGNQSITLYAGLSADEFTLAGSIPKNDTRYYYYTNSLFSNIQAAAGSEFWGIFYSNIYNCNAAIVGLAKTSTLTPAIKQQLIGEAKFMRALFYFYLTNLFGDVPLPLGTDYTVNDKLPNVPQIQIYRQIIIDLKDAKNLLSKNYLDGSLLVATIEKVRPTYWAATALLARTYLYAQKWDSAEIEASTIINSSLYSLNSLNSVFLKNSAEAIFQLQPVSSGQNTAEALLYVLPPTGPSTDYPVYLSQSLASSFESGDQRMVIGNWIDSVTVNGSTIYYPYKYKAGINSKIVGISDLTEYLMVLRFAEQYLIRSEARMQQNNITGAQDDLNKIRIRAGLPTITTSSKTDLQTAIQHENQIEFFSEWGHRWMDLKRTQTVDVTMMTACPKKSGVWHSYQQLYPISIGDIQQDRNLNQNPGY